MIKAIFTDDNGTDGLLIGLSEKNIERLKAGEPIFVKADDSAFPINMIIMVGKTEEDIITELQEKSDIFGFECFQDGIRH